MGIYPGDPLKTAADVRGGRARKMCLHVITCDFSVDCLESFIPTCWLLTARLSQPGAHGGSISQYQPGIGYSMNPFHASSPRRMIHTSAKHCLGSLTCMGERRTECDWLYSGHSCCRQGCCFLHPGLLPDCLSFDSRDP